MSLMPVITPKAELLYTLSFAAAASGVDLGGVTGPATIQAGDLLVLADKAKNGGWDGVPATAAPSGFTVPSGVNINDGAAVRQIISYKIADGTEASASLAGMSGTASPGDEKVLWVFRGNRPIETVSAHGVNGQITDGNPALQAIMASGRSGSAGCARCIRLEQSRESTDLHSNEGQREPLWDQRMVFRIQDLQFESSGHHCRHG
jgi:hypothetical protein